MTPLRESCLKIRVRVVRYRNWVKIRVAGNGRKVRPNSVQRANSVIRRVAGYALIVNANDVR